MRVVVIYTNSKPLQKAIDRRDGGTLVLTFDEAKHPRAPRKSAGKYRAGEFVPKTAPTENAASSTRSPLLPMYESSAVQQQVLSEQEPQIYSLSHEVAVAIGPDGKIVLNKAGSEDTVAFTPEETKRLARVRGGVVFTHNHPAGWTFPADDPRRAGNSFSDADVNYACNIMASEMRAVSPGYVHSLKPGRQELLGVVYRAAIPLLSRTMAAVKNDFWNAISAGTMTIAQAEAEHWHEIWSRAAPQIGWEYRRTPSPYGFHEEATAMSKSLEHAGEKPDGSFVLDEVFRIPIYGPEAEAHQALHHKMLSHVAGHKTKVVVDRAHLEEALAALQQAIKEHPHGK